MGVLAGVTRVSALSPGISWGISGPAVSTWVRSPACRAAMSRREPEPSGVRPERTCWALIAGPSESGFGGAAPAGTIIMPKMTVTAAPSATALDVRPVSFARPMKGSLQERIARPQSCQASAG